MGIEIKIDLNFTTRQKSFLRGTVMTSVMVAVVGVGVAVAAPKNSFKGADVVSADKMNQNFVDLDTRIAAVEAKSVVTKNGKAYSRDATYCGSTVGTTGQLAGYAGAKGFCEGACSGGTSAHMCTGEELIRSRQLGIAVLPATGGWFSAGAYSVFSSSPVRDCLGWTSTSNAEIGPTWDQNGPSGLAACNTSLPTLCCD